MTQLEGRGYFRICVILKDGCLRLEIGESGRMKVVLHRHLHNGKIHRCNLSLKWNLFTMQTTPWLSLRVNIRPCHLPWDKGLLAAESVVKKRMCEGGEQDENLEAAEDPIPNMETEACNFVLVLMEDVCRKYQNMRALNLYTTINSTILSCKTF